MEVQSLTAIRKHYTLEHFANSKIPSLLAGAKMLSPRPIEKFQPPRLQRANQKKPYPGEILEIQSLTAMGKHYTLEHFANSKKQSLLVRAKMLSPRAIEKNQTPDCRGQIRKHNLSKTTPTLTFQEQTLSPETENSFLGLWIFRSLELCNFTFLYDSI